MAEMLIIFWMGVPCHFPQSLPPCHLSSCSQDPRDAPPPTRAETREERMERKVCGFGLVALCLFCLSLGCSLISGHFYLYLIVHLSPDRGGKRLSGDSRK